MICDNQPIYARRLMEYISKREKDRLEIRLYTSVSLMISSLDGKAIAFLLICEEGYKEFIDNGGISIIKPVMTGILVNSSNDSDISERLNSHNLSIEDKTNELVIVNRLDSAEKIRRIIVSGKSDVSIDNTNINRSLKPMNMANRNDETYAEHNAESYAVRLKNIKNQIKKDVQGKLLLKGMLSDDETLMLIDESVSCHLESIDQAGLRMEDKNSLRNSVFYSIRGLDVLEELILDDSITEIMVNGENNIFYEKNGELINSLKSFDSREILLDIIRKIVSDANRTVNMSSPIVDARLKNGSRVNVVLEPVSLEGPILTIRRFPDKPLNAESLIGMGAVTDEIMDFLRRIVFAGYNILISGSTGSGKTTFLNVLSGYIPKDERIITIEDSAELKISGIKNLVRLETRNANVDGCNEITIRDLIRSALRMRPDRIIVGEVRGIEAIDMLQSFLVGQDGSMSTIHANSAEDALYRLEMLMMINGSEIPLNALRRQIATGVDIIIQLVRLKDKSRKLYEIREVTGYNNGEIETSLLYRYEQGRFVKHGDIINTYKLEMAGMANIKQ